MGKNLRKRTLAGLLLVLASANLAACGPGPDRQAGAVPSAPPTAETAGGGTSAAAERADGVTSAAVERADAVTSAAAERAVAVTSAAAETDGPAQVPGGVRDKVAAFQDEFHERCLGRGPDGRSGEAGIRIESRLLPDISAEGGTLTRYRDRDGKVYRYRLTVCGEMGQSESLYDILEDFIYFTRTEIPYRAPLTYRSEDDVA